MKRGKDSPKIFLSYSHSDRKWADRLLIHLRVIADRVDVWTDTLIKSGENWREEINTAIASADVAILLVSANYLASEFIAQQELPRLLENAEKGTTLILPVIVGYSLFAETPLAKFQSVNSPDRPLSSLAESDQDRVFVKVAEAINQRLKTKPEPGTSAHDLASMADDIAAKVVQALGERNVNRTEHTAAVTNESNLVFVIMPFSDDMEPIFEGIKAAANEYDLDAKRVKDVKGDYRISEKILEMILSSRIVIADLTYERPNVYFELGYARGIGKTVITIARQGGVIHFDVQDWTYISYYDSRTLERDLRERFENELRR